MNALALSDNDLTRLIKLLRLLGSTFDGERAAAGQKIHELVTAREADWDVLLRPKPAQAVTVAQAPAEPRIWRVVVEEILAFHYGALYDGELRFLPDLLAAGRAPSEKQSAWLTKIARRCGVPLWDGTS